MQNGVALLPGPITINSQTVEPTFRYNLFTGTITIQTADGYGVDLPITGAGNAVIPNQGSPCLGARDGSVEFDEGKVYQYGTGVFGDVTTEDMIVEGIARGMPDASAGYLFGKQTAAPNRGYNMSYQAAGAMAMALRGATGSPNISSSVGDWGLNVWTYFAFIIDASGFGQCYVGNAASGAAVDVSGMGSLTNTGLLTIGAFPDPVTTFPFDSNIAYLAMYKYANWLDSHLQPDFIKDRSARAIGTKMLSARGTSIPATATRASTAYLQKDTAGVPALYQVGKNWNRVERVADLDGVEKVCVNNEGAAGNIHKYSEDLSNWTPYQITTIDQGNEAIPNFPGDFFDGIVADVNSGQHAVTTNLVANPTNVKHTFFGIFKQGDQPDFWFFITNSVGAIDAHFNLNTGVVGTKRGCIAGMVHWGGGVYFCWLTTTAALDVAATAISLYPSPSDESTTFTGDASTVNLWASKLMCHIGEVPVSYIGPTTTSEVVRAADSLIYKLDDGALVDGKGAIQFDLLIPNHTPVAAIEVLELSDGGAAADRFLFEVDTDGTIKCTMDASGGTTRTATVAGDCADGKWHKINLLWQAGQLVIYRDGVPGTSIVATVAADIPDDLDSLTYGTARVGNVQTFLQPYYPGP
jgi:hypothetical protein